MSTKTGIHLILTDTSVVAASIIVNSVAISLSPLTLVVILPTFVLVVLLLMILGLC